jgi:hypothetical protein
LRAGVALADVALGYKLVIEVTGRSSSGFQLGEGAAHHLAAATRLVSFITLSGWRLAAMT